MSKITPRALDAVFDDSVLEALPTNDKIKRGIGNAKQADKIRGRKNPEHGKFMQEHMVQRWQDNPWTKEQKERASESQRQRYAENPITEEQKQRIGDAMRGKTLEEILGAERAAEGRRARSAASKGKKRAKEVGAKIAASRRANGSYESETHGMRGKQHKEETKAKQATKAQIRQDLKRKLGLGRNDSIPPEALAKAYKKHGL